MFGAQSPYAQSPSKIRYQGHMDSVFTPAPEDDVQKAIFELQDVKNTYFKE